MGQVVTKLCLVKSLGDYPLSQAGKVETRRGTPGDGDISRDNQGCIPG